MIRTMVSRSVFGLNVVLDSRVNVKAPRRHIHCADSQTRIQNAHSALRRGLNGRCPERAAPTGLGGPCGWLAERPLCSLPLAPGRVRWGGLRPEVGLRWTLRPHTPLRFVRAPRTPPLAAIVWEENVIRDEPARTPPPFAVQTFALRTPEPQPTGCLASIGVHSPHLSASLSPRQGSLRSPP